MIGSFAIYHRGTHYPSAANVVLIEQAAQLLAQRRALLADYVGRMKEALDAVRDDRMPQARALVEEAARGNMGVELHHSPAHSD